jgi:transposase
MRMVSLPKDFYYISKLKPVALTAAADQRMQKLKLWKVLKQKGSQDSQISQLLRVSRATLYRWRKRLRERVPKGLEGKSRRPHRRLTPLWDTELVEAVLVVLREAYPGREKDKLCVILARTGWKTSGSTVGRILVDLKRRGVLH